MKQNRVRLLQELLITQMNFLMFFPFGLTLSTLFNDLVTPEEANIFVWMLGGLISFGFYFLRQKIHSFIPLVILHAAGVAIIWPLSTLLSAGSSTVYRVYFMIVAIGFAIYSLYLRLNSVDFNDDMAPMPFTVGFIAVSLFIQHYQGNKEWDSYYKIALILIFIYYLTNYYLSEYLNFLTVNASSTGFLPEKEIFSSGMRMSMVYTVLVAVILFCTAQFTWLKSILSTLKQMVVAMIRFISGLFPKDEPNTEIYIDERVSGDAMMELPEGGEPSIIWQILGYIAVIAVILGLLVALFFALRRFAAFVKEMMQKTGIQPKEISTVSTVDVREKCEISKNRTKSNKSRGIFAFLDNKEKIRRIYKKAASGFKPSPLMQNDLVKKEFSTDRLSFYTAREMEKYMDSGSFSEIYEKARYSDESCTPQDVKLMKELCR